MTTREQRRRRHRRHKRAAARRTKRRLWQRDREPHLNAMCAMLAARSELFDDMRFIDAPSGPHRFEVGTPLPRV